MYTVCKVVKGGGGTFSGSLIYFKVNLFDEKLVLWVRVLVPVGWKLGLNYSRLALEAQRYMYLLR